MITLWSYIQILPLHVVFSISVFNLFCKQVKFQITDGAFNMSLFTYREDLHRIVSYMSLIMLIFHLSCLSVDFNVFLYRHMHCPFTIFHQALVILHCTHAVHMQSLSNFHFLLTFFFSLSGRICDSSALQPPL